MLKKLYARNKELEEYHLQHSNPSEFKEELSFIEEVRKREDGL